MSTDGAIDAERSNVTDLVSSMDPAGKKISFFVFHPVKRKGEYSSLSRKRIPLGDFHLRKERQGPTIGVGFTKVCNL